MFGHSAPEVVRGSRVVEWVRNGGWGRLFGEGTFGLARAFVVAGARSVVMSRWPVDDRAARVFMASFYGALRRGHARDEALAAARAHMADSGWEQRDRMAFVLLGVPDEPVPALVDARPAIGWPLRLLVVGVVVSVGAAVFRRARLNGRAEKSP